MVHKTKNLVVVLFALVAYGCQSEGKKRTRTKQTGALASIAQQNQPLRRLGLATGQFRVLDPSYDFSGKGNFNPSATALRFPVHADGNSFAAQLRSSEEMLAARLQALDHAQKSVRLQTFSFRADETGWRIANKLIELKKRGLHVKVIVDLADTVQPDNQGMYFKLQQNGVGVEGWEPLYLHVIHLINSGDDDFVWDEFNMRFHEKMFIVDAEIPGRELGIVGGSNISNKYFKIVEDDFTEQWDDADIALKGEVVRDMARLFDENISLIAQYKREDRMINLDPIWESAIYVRDVLGMDPIIKINEEDMRPQWQEKIENIAGMSLELEWHPVAIRFLQSRPRLNEDYIFHAYLDFIRSAKEEILIMNSYLIPSVEMRRELRNAQQRGVKVKILTNSREVTDGPLVTIAGRTLYPELLSINEEHPSGPELELYEWKGEPGLGNGLGLHHGKYAVFDGKAMIIGSYNIDPRSRQFSSESVVALENLAIAKGYRDRFNLEIGPGFAKRISLAEARTFRDPSNFLDYLQTKFAEFLKPIF